MKTKSEHLFAKILSDVKKIVNARRKWWTFEDRSTAYSQYVSSKPQKEHRLQTAGTIFTQSGNALIYVLIAIALFAALSFTFARQNKGESTKEIETAEQQLAGTQLIAYAAQVKSVIDQMTLTGTQIDDLDYTLPSETGFNSQPAMDKIYHPSGGGLSPYVLDTKIATTGLTPPSGVYLGLFNNTEWTPSNKTDIMLAAYGISKAVCEDINEKITGNRTIPAVTSDPEEYFVDAAYHSSNQNLEVSDCAACENQLSLCVSNTGATIFTYYTIITPR